MHLFETHGVGLDYPSLATRKGPHSPMGKYIFEFLNQALDVTANSQINLEREKMYSKTVGIVAVFASMTSSPGDQFFRTVNFKFYLQKTDLRAWRGAAENQLSVWHTTTDYRFHLSQRFVSHFFSFFLFLWARSERGSKVTSIYNICFVKLDTDMRNWFSSSDERNRFFGPGLGCHHPLWFPFRGFLPLPTLVLNVHFSMQRQVGLLL